MVSGEDFPNISIHSKYDMVQDSTLTTSSWRNVLFIASVTLLLILVGSIIVLSMVPPVSKDALTHHLAVPKLYLEHGGMYEMPDLVVSYYPMNLELLYTIPLYFQNDVIPKLIHFVFALMTAGLIFFYLKKRIDTLYALFGVLFFLSIPIIVQLSITVYVDLGLIFFSTASLFYLFKWIDGRFKIKHLLISAFFCGLALGTKYNGLITLFLLTLFVPFVYSRKTTRHKPLKERHKPNDVRLTKRDAQASTQLKSVGCAVVFFMVSLAVFSPWLIRNSMWTNNPVYPLYDTYFNSPNIRPSFKMTADQKFESAPPKKNLNHFSLRSHLYNESWWQIALIPFRIFFQGQDGTAQYFDGKLNPLLFFLPFFAFFRPERNFSPLRTEKMMLSAFSILFILLVFLNIDMRIRWVAPAIPPLVLLSVFGLRNICAMFLYFPSPVMRRICLVLVCLILCSMLWSNVAYIREQFHQVDPISYLSGKVGRDEYIERFRHEYPAIQFANQNLAKNAKILCFFLGNRLYYSDRAMIFDETLFKNMVKQTRSPKAVFWGLEKKGVSHLLIRYDLFNNWFRDNFDERERKMMQNFFDEHAVQIFSKYNYGLFELK